MVKVKICGLSRLCDIAAVNAARPDYAGFVFAKSRRQVSIEQALLLRGALDAGIVPVGVFVDGPVEDIVSAVRSGAIEVVQLHGQEGVDYIERLKMAVDTPVIKAVTLKNKGDAGKWASSAADYLLFDGARAGSGRSFDWDLTAGAKKPFFLAGGLSPGNVEDAARRVRPFGVDVSSGVETDGFKDPLKIEEFVRRARNGE